jgi:predicted Zn finger-like uncharacterized protein
VLITTCTHCVARFRVTPQQLNARNGQVRCGRCGKVFSGFEALERVPDDDTGSRLLAAREAADAQAAAPTARASAEEARASAQASDLGESSEDLPELEAIDDVPTTPPAPAEEHAAPPGRAPRAPTTRPLEVDLEALEEEPELRRPSRAWSFGVVLMLLVLGCELAYAFRAPLAQAYPPLRPWMESACARAGCTVPWPRDERLLKLEESELLEVPGHPDQIALAARLRNLATVAQDFPALELSLTDATGQLAARRVLRPADYLGRAPARDEVLGAGAQVAIQLTLVTPGIKPTGYELLLFYP